MARKETKTKTKIRLIGVGPGGFTAGAVDGCVAAVAAPRHCAFVPAGVEIIPVAPLNAAIEAVSAWLGRGDVAVLASGDPLFFGIGRRLKKEFGRDRLHVFPALSSMQILAARTGIPWDDAGFISLHGRDAADAATLLLRGRPKKFILTDNTNTPVALARAMLERLRACGCEESAGGFRITVGENLGCADERITRGTPAEIAAKNFASLNLMLIEDMFPAGNENLFPLEGEISHSRGLITKDEVRAFCLTAINPPEAGVLWDVGAGSGSVGLACALLRPPLTVFAVERREEEIKNISANIKKFRAFNLVPAPGEAPEALSDLPAPDRVFIGGSGGRLDAIIAACHTRLKNGGKMVINAVLEKTAETAARMLTEFGMHPHLSRIAVSRGFGEKKQDMNPITVITGVKT